MRTTSPSSYRRRSAITAVTAVALATLVAGPAADTAAADQTYYVPVTQSWTIYGRGFGHGHGMSQYGAQGAALRGVSYADIVKFYYPGTSWSSAKGKVRVLISADTSSDVQVRPARGLTVLDLRDNTKWRLPRDIGADMWRLTPSGDGTTAVQYHDTDGWHRWRIPDGRRTFRSDGQFSAPVPLTLMVPSGGELVGKRYRGRLRAVRPYPGATVRDTVNIVTLDEYVRGVVPYEMPASWHGQALRSQAVAARTYAVWQRAQNPQRYYQICDTAACQVYGGIGAERRASNDAVRATAAQILTYGGAAAFTQFSSSSGGWTSTGSAAYLPAKRDPYDNFDGNPVHAWSVDVSTSSLERAHPEIGSLVDVRVTRRDGNGVSNGRVEQVVLDGTDGTAYMTGDDFGWHFWLRSTWFTIAPTPIISRWRSLGGSSSDVGTPSTGEYALSTGSAQNFSSGRIYWSSRTGARELTGRLLSAYRGWGGPDSNLGWPESGVLEAPGPGHKARLQGGKIFAKPATGGHVLYGPVLGRYTREDGAGGRLGYPTTDVYATESGAQARFERGTITWDRRTNTTTVTLNP